MGNPDPADQIFFFFFLAGDPVAWMAYSLFRLGSNFGTSELVNVCALRWSFVVPRTLKELVPGILRSPFFFLQLGLADMLI